MAQHYVVYCHMNLMTTLCLDILLRCFKQLATSCQYSIRHSFRN